MWLVCHPDSHNTDILLQTKCHCWNMQAANKIQPNNYSDLIMKSKCFYYRPHRSEMQYRQHGTQLAAKKRPNLGKEGQLPGSCCQRHCKRKEGCWDKLHLKLKWVLGTLIGLSQIRYRLYLEWILNIFFFILHSRSKGFTYGQRT